MNDIRQTLRQYIDENFLFGVETPYGDDDSLLECGIVDSTGVLELISFLEGEFAIRIDDEELVPENLDSVASLARFVVLKLETVPAAAV